MSSKRFIRKQLPVAVALSLGAAGPLPAQVQNPCAAGPRKPADARSGKAANPCAAGPRKAANPCAPAKRKAPAAAVASEAARPFDLSLDMARAPYGDAMPDIVKNYGQAAPYVGTGGVLADGAMEQLRELGFTAVVSLLTEEENAREAEEAEAAGLKFSRIGVSTTAPTRDQVERFGEIMADTSQYPVLVHCSSSNRVGALWALYRARQGVPAEIAIQEGRTVGLKPSREGAVRERLGLDPS
jgi:uncharacterized protein (TIGR01244 family)